MLVSKKGKATYKCANSNPLSYLSQLPTTFRIQNINIFGVMRSAGA